MTCGQASLNLILPAGCRSIWTSTPVYSELPAFPMRYFSRPFHVVLLMLLKFRSAVAGWSRPQSQGTSSSSGVVSSVRFSHSPTEGLRELTCRKDWFDVLDGENRPILTEREILRNLQAIVTDANDTPLSDVGCLILVGAKDSPNVGTGCP